MKRVSQYVFLKLTLIVFIVSSVANEVKSELYYLRLCRLCRILNIWLLKSMFLGCMV